MEVYWEAQGSYPMYVSCLMQYLQEMIQMSLYFSVSYKTNKYELWPEKVTIYKVNTHLIFILLELVKLTIVPLLFKFLLLLLATPIIPNRREMREVPW